MLGIMLGMQLESGRCGANWNETFVGVTGKAAKQRIDLRLGVEVKGAKL